MTRRSPDPAPVASLPPRLLRSDELAPLLGMTPDGLRALRSRGGGPAITRLSRGTIRYAPRDVTEWINSCREQPERTRKG